MYGVVRRQMRLGIDTGGGVSFFSVEFDSAYVSCWRSSPFKPRPVAACVVARSGCLSGGAECRWSERRMPAGWVDVD